MYEKHFGFVQKPFSILPDGSFLYRSKTHNHALTLLEYGLLTGVELMVITGNIGCGKTTLIRYLLDQVPADVDVGLISNPHPPYTDLLKWVLLSFDLDYRDEDKTNQHIAFMEFLLQQHKNNRRALLIVDEAHNFQWETIHQLMTLCNINAEKGLVIQLMLFGLGELDKTLRHPKLTQYAYRLGIRSRIESLDEKATKEYVTHRIKVAGGSESLFQQDCYPRIFHYTQGTPRLINILCDTALAYAYAEQQEQVTQNNVEEVVRDKHGALLKFHNVPYQQRPPALREDTAPTDSTSRLSIPQLIIAKKQTAARKHATEGEGRLPSRLSSAASTRPPANEREKHEPDKPIKLHGTQSVAIKTNREGENKSQALKSDSVSRAAAQRVSRKNPIRQRHGGGPGSVQKPTEKRPIHESANVERSTKLAIQKSRTALNLPNRKVSSVAAIVLTMLVAGLILKLRNTPDSTIHTPPSAGADSVTQQENIATANIQALQDDSIGDPEPSAIAQATLRDQTDNLNATTTTETTPTAELQEQRVVVRHDLKSIELIPDSANDGAVLVRAAARQTKP
ncbi:MAG: AAA family ATPase, partial [Gammaproteobacteria bacterium]|nr:AAA family ATPase [Gammaproteobacteria bacterium]